jgi:hypothetical protein
VSLLWPAIGTSHPDAALPAGFERDRATFEILVLSPVAFLVAVCLIFFAIGAPRRAIRRVGSPAEVSGLEPPPAG